MRRVLNREQVLSAAMSIADAHGLERLTLASLAASLEVKSPSLYTYVESLSALRDHLTAIGFRLLLDRSRTAMVGVAGKDALYALGRSQRDFAKDHPGLWSALHLPVTQWSVKSQEIANEYLDLVLAVFRGYGLTGDDAIHGIRVIRASLRGFIDLELGGSFGMPQDVEKSFETLLSMMDASLRQQKSALPTG